MDPSERDHPDDDRHQTRGGEGQLAPLTSRDEGTKTPLLSELGNPFFTLARPRLIVRLERSLPCCHTVKKQPQTERNKQAPPPNHHPHPLYISVMK